MPKPNKRYNDKLKLAVKVLFELPASVTLPVFKRLSIENVVTLLDQIKEETRESKELSVRESSMLKSQIATTRQLNRANEHRLQIDEFKKQESFRFEDCQSPNKPIGQTSNSPADMIRLATLTDCEIKTMLQHCDTSLWAPALKNAPATIQQKIMNCMAPAAARLLKVEMAKFGDINQQEEKLAREGIIHTAVRLATNGHIMQQTTHESEAA